MGDGVRVEHGGGRAVLCSISLAALDNLNGLHVFGGRRSPRSPGGAALKGCVGSGWGSQAPGQAR